MTTGTGWSIGGAANRRIKTARFAFSGGYARSPTCRAALIDRIHCIVAAYIPFSSFLLA